jgi:hypothetical protein
VSAKTPGLRPALLSALVFPGCGQFANGRPWRAFVFGVATIVPLATLLWRVWLETLARLPQDPVVLLDSLDIGLPFRLASEIQQANAGFFRAVLIILIAGWLASIAEAFLDGQAHGARPSPPPAR